MSKRRSPREETPLERAMRENRERRRLREDERQARNQQILARTRAGSGDRTA